MNELRTTLDKAIRSADSNVGSIRAIAQSVYERTEAGERPHETATSLKITIDQVVAAYWYWVGFLATRQSPELENCPVCGAAPRTAMRGCREFIEAAIWCGSEGCSFLGVSTKCARDFFSTNTAMHISSRGWNSKVASQQKERIESE